MKSVREVLAQIKALIDCRAVAQELNLPHRWGSFLCPFHDDHKPSMSVRATGFKCWACGATGDAIKLVAQVRKVNFRDALAYLASRCGITLPAPSRPRSSLRGAFADQLPLRPVTPKATDDRPTIDPERRAAILTEFAEAARLRPGHAPHAPAFSYLKRRGISAATAVEAGVGFVADYDLAKDWLTRRASVAELQAAALFNAKGNFRLFRHRLVLPYWCAGEVAMLQARNIDWRDKERDGPKELTAGNVVIPFNADVLLDLQEEVYVAEGCIDSLSLMELGFVAVGVPGAGNFRPDWVPLFEDVGEVILCLDNDAAGDEGAEQIAGHFEKAGRTVKRLQLPAGVRDINEFLVADGLAADGKPSANRPDHK